MMRIPLAVLAIVAGNCAAFCVAKIPHVAFLLHLGSPALMIAIAALTSFISVRIYTTVAGWYYGRITHPHGTRCRKCHIILHGLDEPRCPACGERI
jgi:hypothetical protein